MTREEAKKLLPIIEAFANGKIIEYKNLKDESWCVITGPLFGTPQFEYRIKPKYEPKPGTWVMVSIDNKDYYKRFFIQKANNLYGCLSMSTSEDFSVCYDHITLSAWDYVKPLEE